MKMIVSLFATLLVLPTLSQAQQFTQKMNERLQLESGVSHTVDEVVDAWYCTQDFDKCLGQDRDANLVILIRNLAILDWGYKNIAATEDERTILLIAFKRTEAQRDLVYGSN